MTDLPKSASPSEPRALIRKAAEELVAANADHGRTYDNSPDVDETARIISKWLIGAEPRRDEREAAPDYEKLWMAAKSVSSEAWFVLSGGDDIHDKCPACGLAGHGQLRANLKVLDEALKLTPEAARASAAPLKQTLHIDYRCSVCGDFLERCNEDETTIHFEPCKHPALPQPSAGQTEGE